ncbi:MAG: M50 family metallopeptidase [Gloeobacteraceae cyanobacterium ES-bin-144]|nr:M50 family metallopeptidase [Verrucomicrobiales bacterium]
MVRFTIFGIPVQVQPFFWLSLVIISGAGSADSSSAVLRIALFVIAGFISILVHELGHALTARKFGAHSEITLQAFGGYAAYSGVRMTRQQSFMITAAGPLVQIVLGLLVLLLLSTRPALSTDMIYFLQKLMEISLVWAVLNLLPVLPLDGGQLLNAILGPQRIKITLWITIIVAISGAFGIYNHDKRNILFSLFLGMFAFQAIQALNENKRR